MPIQWCLFVLGLYAFASLQAQQEIESWGGGVMDVFKAFSIFEYRRMFRDKRKIAVLIAVLVILMYFVMDGIWKYQKTLEKKEKFQQTEKTNVELFINYTQYGAYGFRLLSIPSPIVVFFANQGVASSLTAFIDSGVRLRIYTPKLAKNLYEERSNNYNDFAGFLLFISTIFLLYWGYDSCRYTDFLRLLASFAHHRLVFFSQMASRLMVFILLIIIPSGLGLMVLVVNNIYLTTIEWLHFLVFIGSTIITGWVIFLIGTRAANSRSKAAPVISMIAAWFLLMVLIPGAVTKFIANKADNISSLYEIEEKKMKVLMDFEKKAESEIDRIKEKSKIEEMKQKSIEGYLKSEFRKIQLIEDRMKSEMKEILNLSNLLSIFSPKNFFDNSCDGIASRSIEDFFDFYNVSQMHHEKFLRYYLNKRYYSNNSKVHPYIKGSGYIYKSRSKLYKTFHIGLMVQLLFILLLFWNSYRSFKRSMFGANPKEVCERPKGNVLRLKRGEFNAWVVNGENFKNKLYSLLSGQYDWFKKHGTNWNVFINGKNASECIKEMDFYYSCSYRAIPGDITVEDFISLLARLSGADQHTVDKVYERISREIKSTDFKGKLFSKLKDQVRADILLQVTRLKKSADCIYMMYDIGIGLPTAFHNLIKKRLDELKNEGAVVMLLMSNDLMDDSREIEDEDKEPELYESKTWSILVENYRQKEELKRKSTQRKDD